MKKVVIKFNDKTTILYHLIFDVWDTIRDWLEEKEIVPAEIRWKEKAKKENFALFERPGEVFDVFAFAEGDTTTVYIVAE